MWYRVFGADGAAPDPEAILATLHRLAVTEGYFRGDDAGWFHANLVCDVIPLSLDRYTADEDGIRAELNMWAALVESSGQGAEHTSLMERIIQTKQLFALVRPDEADGHPLCIALCVHLATETNGVYQIDGDGFFAADGTILLREPRG